MLFVIGLFLPACGGSSSTTAPTPQTPQQSVIVNLTSQNRFEPSNVLIVAGGTVTFANLGGNHNVAANDNSFRCANGCDGMGGNGDPSTSAWSVTITFPNPGSVGYSCEVHVGVGMTGTVNIQ